MVIYIVTLVMGSFHFLLYAFGFSEVFDLNSERVLLFKS